MTISPEPRQLDHRDINRDLDVFATDPLVGSGLPLWLPAGAVIRHELELLAAEIARGDGCVSVYSPVLAKRALFETSGHWAKFSDDMFPPMRIGGEELVLRPANCPHHAMIYAARPRSYRELPIRLHELAPMFRAERSGVLSGLSRVRQINLDDTHVFCRPDQTPSEVERALRSALHAHEVLGLPVDYVRLSRRGGGGGYLGSTEQWQQAEEALRAAAGAVLSARDLALVEAEGEAAFYGPKLDLQVRDGRGHEESIATVQLDFSQPDRFGLDYNAADGSRQRVVMIHRGTVGAMERVVAALLERYQGRLPLWLAPVQVCVMPVGPAQDGAAHALADDLGSTGLRASIEVEGSLGGRVRASRRRRDCVIAVIGASEVEAGEVQVLDVAAGFKGAVPNDRDLIDLLSRSHAQRVRRIEWPKALRPAGSAHWPSLSRGSNSK
ncbi:MAG: aminoacyl--tRNA ligase-related protein [Acidimicrobiales bacterium]